MPSRHLSLTCQYTEDVLNSLAALRTELGLPAMFSPEVLDDARASSEKDLWAGREDRRDLPLVTIDPPGSMDLDQAVHVESTDLGYRVFYAIADVAAFVNPGGPLDAEVNKRGTTIYGPDMRTPLHPTLLSEGVASLLPDKDTPAALWTIELDARGEITWAEVKRAMVCSRERLTYGEVQASLDDGTASQSLQLLADVGRLRQARERERGGVSLDVPAQSVEQQPDGSFDLEFRSTLPVEGWNAQISLLTGISAARLMRAAGIGIFRTLPKADPRDVRRLRRTARALGIDWPKDMTYANLLPKLNSRRPAQAAFLNEATTLFRGAAYLAFGVPPAPDAGDDDPTGDGSNGGEAADRPGIVALPDEDAPDNARDNAPATEYAHVTAPLRRLVDRYGTEICLAYCKGDPVPDWVREALPGLPVTMSRVGRLANSFERSCIDVVEAVLLQNRVGQRFDAVVIDSDTRRREAPFRGEVVLRSPAVRARVTGPEELPLGEPVKVTLAEASVTDRRVGFTLP
jgi:exoribonuclease R